MYIHDYDPAYYPAIPVVMLGIGLIRNDIPLTIVGLVDSGADATMIPVSYLQELGALPDEEKWLKSVTGERVMVELYPVFLQIGDYGLYTSVIGDETGNEVIVGRDVLNQFIVTLNGLASVVEISQ